MRELPQGPSVKEAQAILDERRNLGWVDLVLQYGKNFIFQGALTTSDPEIVQALLTHRPHTQHRSVTYKFARAVVPGSTGVLFMDGKEWQQHIHTVMPVFTKTNIDSYAQTIHEQVTTAISGWQDGQSFDDLYQIIVELGLKVLLRVGYGLDPQAELTRQFGERLNGYKTFTMTTPARIDDFGVSTKQLKRLPVFVRDHLRLRQHVVQLREAVRLITADRQRNGKPYDGLDWITCLQDAGFPLNLMTDELNHIYGAFNAIDYTLTCAFKELSQRPDLVQALRTELTQVLGSREYVTREDFDALPRTINFMKEVFRYYPVAMAVARCTGEALPVEDSHWPANKEVLIMICALHYHPDYWTDDPFTFNPDRWNAATPHVPGAYIPFLTGPRQCIGRHLAELHFVATLNAVLQQFSFDVLDHSPRIGPYLIPRFQKPIPCVVRQRESIVEAQ